MRKMCDYGTFAHLSLAFRHFSLVQTDVFGTDTCCGLWTIAKKV